MKDFLWTQVFMCLVLKPFNIDKQVTSIFYQNELLLESFRTKIHMLD